MNTLKITSLIALTFLMSACESADDITLEQARSCMNGAMKISISDPTTAAARATVCEASVRNLTSAESGRIGFSAILIMEGKIAQIANSAGALSSSTNTIGTSMSYMAFSTNTNIAQMDIYVARAGSDGITKIAALVKAATLINAAVALTGGTEITPANIATFIGGSSAATQDAVAASLVAFQQSTCAGSGSTTTACSRATQATAGASTAAILASFQTFLGTTN